MKQLLFVLMTSAIFFACREHTENEPAVDSAGFQPPLITPDTPSRSLQLQTFDSIPAVIDGCGDYYAADTAKTPKAGTYVFLSNMTEFALIRINGSTVRLERNAAQSKEVSPSHFIATFEGEGYKATLEAKIHEQYDEGGFYKGTLQIERNNEKIVLNVHGETGC